MTKDETYHLGDHPVVQLLDGALGLFLIWPLASSTSGLCGIQVPGEPEHRWIHHNRLHSVGGVLFEMTGVEA